MGLIFIGKEKDWSRFTRFPGLDTIPNLKPLMAHPYPFSVKNFSQVPNNISDMTEFCGALTGHNEQYISLLGSSYAVA